MLHPSLPIALKGQRPRASNDEKSMVLFTLAPERCRPWSYHNRDQAWFTLEGCRDLIKSIEKHGQLEPVIVRALEPGSEKDFEIIAGARRWFACSQIPQQKLLARVIEADDRSCMLLMHAENADAQDISDFERAYSFAVQLKSGAFKNQTDLAKAVQRSQSTICKMIKAAELFEYPWLEALFESKLELPIRLAYRLSTLLKRPGFYIKIEAEAKVLLEEKKSKESKLSARVIFKRLIQCVRSEVSMTLAKASVKQERILFEREGKALMLVKEDQYGSLALSIHPEIRGYGDEAEIASLCLKAIHDYFL